jgi:small subunit ribosomal protein S2
MRIVVNNLTRRSFSSAAAPALEIESKQIEVPSKISRVNPLTHPDYFGVGKLFTVRDLFEARVHFGHKDGSVNEHMKPYLFGSRLGHTVFNLDTTAEHLKRALNITAHTALQGGLILFFCRSAINSHMVEKTARECGEFAHTRYWRGGTFTNSKVQFKAVTRLPDLCIFLNTLNNVMLQHTAVRDAAKMNIPSVGIVDSNCSPDLISYVVPGNDDSPASIELYCSLFKEAILRGKAKRKEILVDIEKLEKEQEALDS